MAVRNTYRIRFTFNRATGASSVDEMRLSRKTDAFASTIIQNVGVEVAQGAYTKLRRQISSSLEPAIRRELRHLTQLYAQFIIGKQRVGGSLTTLVRGTEITNDGYLKPQESVPLRSSLPAWAPLTRKYMRRKERLGLKTPAWFKYKTNTIAEGTTPKAWEQMFGPIHVTVQPMGKSDYNLKVSYRQIQRGQKLRLGVATIRASVFGLLTPREVAAIATGKMDGAMQTSDGRFNGLLEKVASVNPEMAFRLGHNSRPGHKYRPSLEPFLAFAITRSVPAAINRQLSVDTARTARSR